MDMIQSFLKDADIRAEKDHMDNVAKTWVKQVREEAYQIEDVLMNTCSFSKTTSRAKAMLLFSP